MSIHIKYLHLNFQILPDFKPYVDFSRFGTVLDGSLEEIYDMKQLNISLQSDVIYDIAFDQSTKNTGIFIKAHNNSEIYMIEVYKRSNTTTEEYMFELETFIHTLCSGKKILHLIYERPIKSSNFRSSQVLFQLEGLLRMLCMRYEEFKPVKYDTISKTSWASKIVDTSQYGSDYTSKTASKNSVIKLFPWSSQFGSSLYQDNDGYEAVGILMGWFIDAFDPFGRPYVRGDKFNGNIGCTILPGVPYDIVYTKLQEEGIDAKWFIYNPKNSIFQNIVKAATKDCVVLVYIEDPFIKLALSIEANLRLFDLDFFTLVIITTNFMSTAARQVIGSEFHFYL